MAEPPSDVTPDSSPRPPTKSARASAHPSPQWARREDASGVPELADSMQEQAAYYHIVFLRNQRGPRVLLVGSGLGSESAPYDCFTSNSPCRFELDGNEIITGGEGRTAGFKRHALVHQCCLVVADEPEAYKWERQPDVDEAVCTRPMELALMNLHSKISSLFKPAAVNPFGATPGLVEDRHELDGAEVPDLHRYCPPGSALALAADCGTQKSRKINRWLRDKLKFNPQLRVLFISCRVTHAMDLHSDLSELDISIYTDGAAQREKAIVQLNSLPNYNGMGDYDIVVLDEVVSILAYLHPDNRTLNTKKNGRSRDSSLLHVQLLGRFCREARHLIVADAHMNVVDDRVFDFLRGVRRDKSNLVRLTIGGKNPHCKRTLRVRYENSRNQSVMPLQSAVEAVQQDPEKRIAIFCGAKDVLCRGERTKGGAGYEQTLRKHGIAADDIEIVHAESGDDDKQALFQDLDGQLQSKKAFICNSAITVGLNPTVKFGKVFLHTCRTGACVRDMFQLVHRIGRSEGGLADTVIEVTIHDKPLEQKMADRTAAAAGGEGVPKRPLFAAELSKIQDRMKSNAAHVKRVTDGTRSGTFSTHGGYDSMPEWYAKVAAWNSMERKLTMSFHTEEFLKYAKFHGWTIEVCADDGGGDTFEYEEEAQSEDNLWKTRLGADRYEHVRELYADPAPEDEEFLSKLIARETDGRDLSAKQKAVQDVYHKVHVPFGGWGSFEAEDITALWRFAGPMKSRAKQRLEELLTSQVMRDRAKAFTETGKVDTSVQLESQRIQGGLELRRLLSLSSLVDKMWTLPQEYVDAVNAQLNARDDQRGIAGSFPELYAVFQAVCPKIKPPVDKRARGSALLEALRTVMGLFDMKERWAAGGKKKAIVDAGVDDEGRTIRKLHAGYGFQPRNQEMADKYLISIPGADRRVAVADLPETVDELEQPFYDAQMAEIADELQQYAELFTTTAVSGGDKMEIFHYDRLQKLLAVVCSNPQRFADDYLQDKIDPKTGDVKSKMEQVASMVTDMKKLLQYDRDGDGYGVIRDAVGDL